MTPTRVFVITDDSMTTRYTLDMLTTFVQQDKAHKHPSYQLTIEHIPHTSLSIPDRLLTRHMCSLALKAKEDAVWLDGSDATQKASRIIEAISTGDAAALPALSHFVYRFDSFNLTVVRPGEFTTREVCEYYETPYVPPPHAADLAGQCHRFVEGLEDGLGQTTHTVLATAQKVVVPDGAVPCASCLLPFKPFLEAAGVGVCRACCSAGYSPPSGDDVVS